MRTKTDWTTDERMKELLARGVDELNGGNEGSARIFLSAMGTGIRFRRLKLAEAMSKKKSES